MSVIITDLHICAQKQMDKAMKRMLKQETIFTADDSVDVKVKKLANHLRQRQYKLKQVPRHIVDALPDMEMIWAYLKCPKCGWMAFETDDQLKVIIEYSTNVEDFWLKCGCFDGNMFVCGGVHDFDKRSEEFDEILCFENEVDVDDKMCDLRESDLDVEEQMLIAYEVAKKAMKLNPNMRFGDGHGNSMSAAEFVAELEADEDFMTFYEGIFGTSRKRNAKKLQKLEDNLSFSHKGSRCIVRKTKSRRWRVFDAENKQRVILEGNDGNGYRTATAALNDLKAKKHHLFVDDGVLWSWKEYLGAR